jgi:hypothetical protein
MLRWLLILGLVASLLWCPLRCFAAPVGGIARSESPGKPDAARKCTCCRHCEKSRPTQAKEPLTSEQPLDSDDCNCGDCLCRGAVVKKLDDIAGLTSATHATLALISLEPIDASLRLDHAVPWFRFSERASPSGREVSIRYGNLRR